MQPVYFLPKENFPAFLEALKGLGSVYAPVKVSKQSYSFKAVEKASEIAFEALRTILPPKKFFYPPSETLISYDDGRILEYQEEPEFKVIFGVHPCDLAGLGIMDTIFEDGPADSHYVRRRRMSMLVGLSCMPDKHCFCQSMGTDCPEKGYDIFLTDIEDGYFLQSQSTMGGAFLDGSGMTGILERAREAHKDRYKEFWIRRKDAFSIGFAPDNLRATMDMEWDNPVWEELGNRCLSCGNCTPVCPTCYCFDLVDVASLSGDSGERRREWDSCQFTGFAQVAGDFNFRPGPVDRLKFWYRHKLHGFDDAYGFKTCVGCGRCTVSCPSGIDDIVAVVNILQSSKKAENKSDAT
ncbi:MAG: 4Fe-4S dicluster domain-containing protein [Candidatus Obscuribacter sp.]|nr:4Fe-4S dicluster domain-containing protein [Candidatus Melainabacteria bacterium]MDX1990612.1 4Fe-4S dicluster domain-containing protein [Candidatus Obscuribacter sp.]